MADPTPETAGVVPPAAPTNSTTKNDLLHSLMGDTNVNNDQDLFGALPVPTTNGNGVGATTTAATTTTATTPPSSSLLGDSSPTVDGPAEPQLQTVPPPPPQQQPHMPEASMPAPPPSDAAGSPPAVVPPPAAPSTSARLSASGLLGVPTTTEATVSSGHGVHENDSGGGGGGLFDDIDEEEETKRRQEHAAAALQQQQQQQADSERRLQEQQQQQQQVLLQQQQQQAEADRLRQLNDQMQSIHLGAPPPLQQQQYADYNNHHHQQQQLQPPFPQGPSYGSPQRPPQQQQPQYGGQSYAPQQQQPPQSSPMAYSQAQSGYGQPQPPPQQQQLQQQQQQQQQPAMIDPPVKQVADGFYRDHAPPGQSPQQQQQHQQPPHPAQSGASTSRYYQPTQAGSVTAGMHGVHSHGRSPYRTAATPHAPPPTAPGLYHKVTVSEPMLLQSAPAMFGLGQPPHWSYQITTELTGGQGVWMVRRRFRHVVSLEDRMREDCPGAILPPRPDKHATRALEEASTHQSAEFALQRAAELQYYLNQIILHPIVASSNVVRLFLALQDDLGTAWPECSSNALTRLASAGVGAAVKVSEHTKLPWQSGASGGVGGGGGEHFGMDEYGEDNAELLALQNGESIRMGAVLQAVPKMEGAVTLLREHAEQAGTVGMELSRLAKEVEVTDRELGQPLDIVSAGLLRGGRRSKRLGLELGAALQPFSQQYKLCRYERMAFSDRRAAIQRRYKERGRADSRAAQLHQLHQRQQHMQQHAYQQQQHMHQHQQQPMHQHQHMMYGQQGQLAQQAAASDDIAVDANQECDEIGRRLVEEVNRIGWNRKIEWHASVKVIASACKEAVTERVAIWETVRENFMTTFPEYNVDAATGASNGGAANGTVNGAVPNMNPNVS